MRILLCIDMEGISQITSYRELWPAFPEYWETGRPATTTDALAAIDGLMAGGATEITVCELHGPVPDAIIETDELPEGATWARKDDVLRQLANGNAYDALFMLGWHARCGTPDGFFSHTEGVNLRIAVDGDAVTEAHLNAWRAGVPILGITGDEALGRQLVGVLEGVPFLPVKRACKRAEAEPLYPPEEGPAAIEAFATWCVQNASARQTAPIPDRFVLSMSMLPAVADLVDGEHGLRRTSPAIVARSVTDWWYEAEPAIRAAMQASFSTWHDADDNLERLRSYLTAWASASEAAWLT